MVGRLLLKILILDCGLACAALRRRDQPRLPLRSALQLVNLVSTALPSVPFQVDRRRWICTEPGLRLASEALQVFLLAERNASIVEVRYQLIHS